MQLPANKLAFHAVDFTLGDVRINVAPTMADLATCRPAGIA